MNKIKWVSIFIAAVITMGASVTAMAAHSFTVNNTTQDKIPWVKITSEGSWHTPANPMPTGTSTWKFKGGYHMRYAFNIGGKKCVFQATFNAINTYISPWHTHTCPSGYGKCCTYNNINFTVVRDGHTGFKIMKIS